MSSDLQKGKPIMKSALLYRVHMGSVYECLLAITSVVTVQCDFLCFSWLLSSQQLSESVGNHFCHFCHFWLTSENVVSTLIKNQ